VCSVCSYVENVCIVCVMRVCVRVEVCVCVVKMFVLCCVCVFVMCVLVFCAGNMCDSWKCMCV